jgi:hypothetical protein
MRPYVAIVGRGSFIPGFRQTFVGWHVLGRRKRGSGVRVADLLVVSPSDLRRVARRFLAFDSRSG